MPCRSTSTAVAGRPPPRHRRAEVDCQRRRVPTDTDATLWILREAENLREQRGTGRVLPGHSVVDALAVPGGEDDVADGAVGDRNALGSAGGRGHVVAVVVERFHEDLRHEALLAPGLLGEPLPDVQRDVEADPHRGVSPWLTSSRAWAVATTPGSTSAAVRREAHAWLLSRDLPKVGEGCTSGRRRGRATRRSGGEVTVRSGRRGRAGRDETRDP
jgi:hypothetical protein